MGRTINTYRLRMDVIGNRLKQLTKGYDYDYDRMIRLARNLAAPASTFPYADATEVMTFSVILELYRLIIELELAY